MIVSIIVPTYNESKTIIKLLEEVNAQRSLGTMFEVIVVNDGSTDNTTKLINENIQLVDKYISLETNSGKGAAVKQGLLQATGDYILFQDADLEYSPSDYHKFFKLIDNKSPDVIMGSRLSGSEFTKVMYFWHKIGNKLLTYFFNILFNTTFTDVYTCYLLYKKDLVDPTKLKSTGWQQHAEILSTAVKRGEDFFEVPITYNGRKYEDGKKIKPRHFFSVIFMIFKKRLF